MKTNPDWYNIEALIFYMETIKKGHIKYGWIKKDAATKIIDIFIDMANNIKKNQKELFETLASIQHGIWAHWQKYMHSILIKNADGSLTITKDKVEHWERQIKTDYKNLTEKEKNSDRDQVKKYFDLISEETKDKGNISDGFHTFNELYDHRIALYLALVSILPTCFWKSLKHNDGTMFDGWFILGGDFGKGQISYHLPLSKWELAKCEELPVGKIWDGHTPADVVKRIYIFLQGNK